MSMSMQYCGAPRVSANAQVATAHCAQSVQTCAIVHNCAPLWAETFAIANICAQLRPFVLRDVFDAKVARCARTRGS